MALSTRGQELAKLGPELLIWQIVKNLWDPVTNPDGFVSLGVAENSLMHEEMSKYIHSNTQIALTGLTYGDGGQGSRNLRQAMARFLNRSLRPIVPIEPTHICVTNGVTTAIEHISSILGDPGDAFLLGQPHYGAFLQDIELRPGLQVVQVPFAHIDPLSNEAVDEYEKAIKSCQARNQRVAGVMLCNPHNPLGRCYSRDFIIKLMKLCQKHKVHLVSDEIYALSVFRTSGAPDEKIESFTSLSSIPTDGIIDASLTHVLYGISKDFGANGIRLGAITSQHNPQLHDALIPVAINSYASSLAEGMATRLFSDDEFIDYYTRENQRRLKSSYELVIAWAKKHGIEYGTGVNAAFFLWVNLGKCLLATKRLELSTDDDITQIVNEALLAQKIFLASSATFGGEQPGWFRIVFSHKPEYLTEGLRRIEQALGLESTSSDHKKLYTQAKL